MVTTSVNTQTNQLKSNKKEVTKETLLTPRFYTTDFETAATISLKDQETQLQAMLTEMRNDYNRYHFVRDETFKDLSLDHLDKDTREGFVEYLERSCISEFSGFLLFKELSRKIKKSNPTLAEIFHLMARDEARHAGFLNKAMADFNVALDLGKITRTRNYTFFPLEWIIYTVYLSEKIGYWRYIVIFHHLEKHPEKKFYPIFDKFENWCQDENRNGDIFNALLRSQPKLWNDWKARLWSRFFLLAVFVTHTLTVHERAKFYKSLGLDPTEFDKEVIRETNNTAARAFPSILDVENPEFYSRLQRCSERNLAVKALQKSNKLGIIKTLGKILLFTGIAGDFFKAFLIKPIDTEALRGDIH